MPEDTSCIWATLFKTSRKAFTFLTKRLFLLLFEINIVVSIFYTKWRICVSGGGELSLSVCPGPCRGEGGEW